MNAEHPYARVTRELTGSPFAAVRCVETTASTNADASHALGDADFYGTSIVAESQTHGRGRKGRSWIAEPGSALLVTTILPRAIRASSLWAVPFWSALALRSALSRNGVPASLCWPNDLLLDGKKVAGILCISRVAGEIAWAACGIGVNVHRHKADVDAIVPAPAFCDDVAPVERAILLRDLLQAYDATLGNLDDPASVARAWERAAGLPGARYRLQRDGETEAFDARAIGLADGGALIVERNGGRETVSMADVRALR